MIKTINAQINYDTTKEHTDTNGKALKNLSYKDTYKIDTDCFYGDEDITDYIKNDLLLVAGGGYDWKNITNINFAIK